MPTNDELIAAANTLVDGLVQKLGEAIEARDIRARVEDALADFDAARAEFTAVVDAWVAEHIPPAATEA